MKWTNDDVKLVEKFIQIKNKGYYANGGELTVVYNRVLEKNVPPTNCGSCIRARITELENALNQFKKQMENKAISSPSETNSDGEVNKDKGKAAKAARKPKNDASEVTQQPE